MLLTTTAKSADRDLFVRFESYKDTVKAGDSMWVVRTMEITISKQSKIANIKLLLVLDKQGTNLETDKILFPQTLPIDIHNLDEERTFKVPIHLKRDNLHERTVRVKVQVQKSDGSLFTLDEETTTREIYLEAFTKAKTGDAKKEGGENFFEPWLFTGTNLDPLSGSIVKNIYFKFNLFAKVYKKDNFQVGLYNSRNISNADSIIRNPFLDAFITRQNLKDTTISLVNGVYNKSTITSTEPLGVYLEYDKFLTGNNGHSLYWSSGFEIGQIKTKTSFQVSNIVSDTNVVKVANTGTILFKPLPFGEVSIVKPNYYINTGLLYVYNDTTYNIKVQLLAGINNYWQLKYVDKYMSIFDVKNLAYGNLKFTGVLKKAPAIGLGFDVVFRANSVPIFNINFFKVLNFSSLTSLFSTVSNEK